MSGIIGIEWWVTGIGVPVVTGLLTAITLLFKQLQAARNFFSLTIDNLRETHDRAILDHRRAADTQLLAVQADLQAFKLRVAETFVSNPSMREFMKDFESRIMHLMDLNREAIIILDKKLDRLIEKRFGDG